MTEKSKTEEKLEENIEKVEDRDEKQGLKQEARFKEEQKEELKEAKIEEKLEAKAEEKAKEEKPKEENKADKKASKPRVKKSEAVVNANNLPISTKHSMAICMFIKNKKISTAISELEQVAKAKKAVPMKGEIPHRRGKGMMAGRFPKKSSEEFIKLLKSLNSNAIFNGIENPVIVEAVPNLGARPFGRFGAHRKKRTHVRIVAKEMPTGGKK